MHRDEVDIDLLIQLKYSLLQVNSVFGNLNGKKRYKLNQKDAMKVADICNKLQATVLILQ